MHTPGDRPRPIDFKHQGIALKIAFQWKDPGSVPSAAIIYPADQTVDDLFICDAVIGDWSSYEDAVNAAKAAAIRWIGGQPNQGR